MKGLIKRRLSNNTLAYLIASCITLTALILLFYSPNFDYTVPLSYGNTADGIYINSAVKSVFDTKKYVHNPYLSAPVIFDISDYPIYTPFGYVAIRLIANFFREYGSVLNTLYFLTYFLATLISLTVFRRLGLTKIFAVVASVLFSFLPFHILRGVPHLFLNFYFVVPIFVYLAFLTFKSEEFFGGIFLIKDKATKYRKIQLTLFCILASCCCTGGYFAYFGCFIILIAGLVSSIEKLKWGPLLSAFVFIAISTLTVLASISPKILSTIHNGNNSEAVARVASDAERFSLSITHLIFPVNDHRVGKLREFKDSYNINSPLTDFSGSLGIIGGVGFLLSLLVVLIKRFQSNITLYILSVFNFSCLLLGTTGGFGALVAYTFFESIRGYDRIVVYVAFCSLYVFFATLQIILKKYSLSKNKIFVYLLALILLMVGLLDQTPIVKNKNQNYINSNIFFKKDKDFIGEIESRMKPQSRIFQLPFQAFPEGGVVYHLSDYDHFRAYLHSKYLCWSYGALKGSAVCRWQQSVTRKPVPQMLRDIAFAGFTGLYINRNGYPDHARGLEKEISVLVYTAPILNAEKDIVFYDLKSYVKKLQDQNSVLWKSEAEKIANTFLLNANWGKGFYYPEISNNEIVHCCTKKEGQLCLVNQSKENMRVHLSFKLKTWSPTLSDMRISGDLINSEFKINDKDISFTRDLRLTPGFHYLNFKTNGSGLHSKADGRSLYFRVDDFSLTLK